MQRRGSSQGGRQSRGKHRAGVEVQLGTWSPAFCNGRARWEPGRNTSLDRPSDRLGRSWRVQQAGLDATADRGAVADSQVGGQHDADIIYNIMWI